MEERRESVKSLRETQIQSSRKSEFCRLLFNRALIKMCRSWERAVALPIIQSLEGFFDESHLPP